MRPVVTNPNRAGVIALVVLIHALIAYAFVTGLALRFVKTASEDLKTFDVAVPAPPAEEPPAPPEQASESELSASPTPLESPNKAAAAAAFPGESDVRPSGAVASGAVWRRGSFDNERDYPSGARQREEQGSVRIQYVIGTDGRVASCSVIASSGSSTLDSTTCRIIERRFRYTPARDSLGNPVNETRTQTVTWRLT